jgi:hypothetical protein
VSEFLIGFDEIPEYPCIDWWKSPKAIQGRKSFAKKTFGGDQDAGSEGAGSETSGRTEDGTDKDQDDFQTAPYQASVVEVELWDRS